jgi:hypothetical protein
MTEELFENLISKNESSTLDFKEHLYDFNNDSNLINTSKYVKDIISFCNTIRNEKSYIIFGIKENDDKNECIGISKSIDDSILQEKIKDKVFPRPIFKYFTFTYNTKTFGIIEFPIIKYELPITPTIQKLKGLEAGKVYYRNGSSNTEANGLDVIRINKWMESLPGNLNSNSINEKISEFLIKLTKNEEKLSTIITEIFSFAKVNQLNELIKYTEIQILGLKNATQEERETHEYRIQKVFISLHKIEINPYSIIKNTVENLKSEFKNNKDFYESNLFFYYSLIEIEDFIEQLNLNKKQCYGTVESNSKELLEMEKAYPLFIYFFPENLENVYKNVRQKTIDILMKI